MFDVIIIWAGASGLFCWMLLPKDKKKLILEKTGTIGSKVLLSGKGDVILQILKLVKIIILEIKEKDLISFLSYSEPKKWSNFSCTME